jgi:hypothetical protein
VVGVILTIPQGYEQAQNNRLERQMQFATNSLAENISLRAEILNYNASETSGSTNNLPIMQRINQSIYSLLSGSKIDIKFKVCLANETCLLETDGVEQLYVIERIIATNVLTGNFLPKKIKIVALEIQ